MRVEHKTAISIGEALKQLIVTERMRLGHNTRRIFEAWDRVSGAEAYTTRRFFREGKLYITLNSSVARSRLSMQKQVLVDAINAALQEDELYIKDEKVVSTVKELILK